MINKYDDIKTIKSHLQKRQFFKYFVTIPCKILIYLFYIYIYILLNKTKINVIWAFYKVKFFKTIKKI